METWYCLVGEGAEAEVVSGRFARSTNHYLYYEDGVRIGKLSGFGRWFRTPAEAVLDRQARLAAFVRGAEAQYDRFLGQKLRLMRGEPRRVG